MTAGQWDALGDLYASHDDPSTPENAAAVHAAQEWCEMDILFRQGRLP